MLKLHLGCGKKFIPGFCHIDIIPGENIDYVSKIDKLTFIDDNSVDLIYASHVLEHFGRWEYKNVLKDWYRLLKKGGTLRLSVPDFGACVQVYNASGLENGLTGLVGLFVGGQRNKYDYHKMIFDRSTLKDALFDVGFVNVNAWDWKHTEHSNIDDYSQAYLPHMDKEHGLLMSLNLEGTK